VAPASRLGVSWGYFSRSGCCGIGVVHVVWCVLWILGLISIVGTVLGLVGHILEIGLPSIVGTVLGLVGHILEVGLPSIVGTVLGPFGERLGMGLGNHSRLGLVYVLGCVL
jgi:hypothetical protein